MGRSLIESYEEPIDHERASGIIRLCSSNPVDVRRFALEGRDLSSVRTILDAGCGFGFMAEEVAARAHPEAVVWGVDLCATNRREFLRRVRATGRSARFLAMRLENSLPWPSAEFDLVLSSYSLYFFPSLLPEVVRVLKAGGWFLALTHTLASQRDLLEAVGMSPEEGPPLVQVVGRFSAENGRRILAPHFRTIESKLYENSLRFGEKDFAALASYLRFKLMLVSEQPSGASVDGGTPTADPGGDAASVGADGRPVVRAERLRRALRGGLEIRKDDMAFWCSP